MIKTKYLKKPFLTALTCALLLSSSLHTQTIAEKKLSFTTGKSGDLSKEMHRFLVQINEELREQQDLLRTLYRQVRELFQEGASEYEYADLLTRINQVRENITLLESSWREMAADNNQEEGYALWHQPDTTIGDLVIDYGSQDFVYLMSTDIEDIPLSVNSNIPIPRASWNQMLEVILNHNGIGVKELNPYLRQLYMLKEDNSTINLITNSRNDLNAFPPEARVCYVLSPDPVDVRRIWFFLEKFVNPNNSEVQMLGRDILIIAPVKEVKELLKLYDFVESNSGTLEYRIIPLKRVDAEQMGKILSSIFEQFTEETEILEQSTQGTKNNASNHKSNRERGPQYQGSNGLKIITLADVAQALFLIGRPEEISKAEDIIQQVEAEVGEAREKVIYTYVAKHTDTVELSDILERVYAMMLQGGPGVILNEEFEEAQNVNLDKNQNVTVTEVNNNRDLLTANEIFNPGYVQEGTYMINPGLIQPGASRQGHREPNRDRTNFIVDVKTGTIVMVVEAIFLPRLKELIKKLDVPKKMVQIEVLLFEKQIDQESLFSLNLFRLGSKASNTDATSLTFNDINPIGQPSNILNLGILEFTLSRICGMSGIAAYDLAYRFLLSRDDITINSNPSVVAINQTTATIEIKDQISLNVGTLLVQSTGGAIPANQFVREEYGVTIKVTPTVHMRDPNDEWYSDDEETNYVTLQTDITFDTIIPSTVDRPDVTRRHIVNDVRIADGQTVIIGGLRRKESNDFVDKIPLLGELPGIGKLFSDTRLEDRSREMYIFLTPKIISDPAEEMDRLRAQQLCRRPGDIPAFLYRLDRARECEKKRLFEGYLTMILGKPPAPIYFPPREYDGRCY